MSHALNYIAKVAIFSVVLQCIVHANAQWTPATPAAQAVQNALNKVIESGGSSNFILPAEDLYFNDAPFNVTHAHGINIVGTAGKTTLYFAPGVGLRVQNSSSTSVQNIAIDYFPLPYVNGVVLPPSASHPALQVRLGKDSLTFAELIAKFPPHDTWSV